MLCNGIFVFFPSRYVYHHCIWVLNLGPQIARFNLEIALYLLTSTFSPPVKTQPKHGRSVELGDIATTCPFVQHAWNIIISCRAEAQEILSSNTTAPCFCILALLHSSLSTGKNLSCIVNPLFTTEPFIFLKAHPGAFQRAYSNCQNKHCFPACY